MLEEEGATKMQALLGSEILLTGQGFRRDGQQAPKGQLGYSADTCLVGLGIALVGVLLISITLGYLYNQFIATRVDKGVLSSPSNKQHLAQRQLAELRDRRHGFAQ